MLTFVIGLLVGLLLAFASADQPGDRRDRVAPMGTIGPNVEGDVIPCSVPSLIHVYDEEGALLHEWTANPYGLIGWTRRPELLIFVACTAGGQTIVAGSPSDGALYEISQAPAGWFEYARQPDMLVFHAPGGDRLIALPGEIVQPLHTEGYPDAAGAFRAAADGVRRHDELLLEDRGLEFSLLASPSGRWAAVVERQPANTYVIWSIDARSGNPAFERMVDYAELPLDFADGDPLSPNRRWSVTTGTVHTVLRRADELVKILPVGGFSQPLWRDDSGAFLLNSIIGTVLVDVPEATLRVVISGAASILGWRGDRVLWFAQTVGSDE